MNKQQTDIGTCPSHWDVVKFSSVAELKHGYQFRTNDFTDKGIKVFKITQIKSDGSIDLTSCSFIDASRIESFKSNIINYGDILMALSGATIGKIGRFKSNEVVLQNYRVGNFIPLDEKRILKDYFYYFLTTENTYFQIIANQNQSAQENVGKADIHNMLVFLPPFEEQKSIAEVLSSLDDKIDLLHRQNQTLEQMAETLFRQWFVEEADEGWEETTLFDAIELVGGGTPKTSIEEYWNGNIKWLSGGDIASNHKSIITSSEKTITEEGLNNSSAKLLPKFSTVISARGTVGKYCIISEPMAYSQSNYGIKPKYQDCYFFTYLLINHSVEELNSAAYGSVFDTITTNTFKGLEIALPSEKEIKAFEAKVENYFFKILNNQTHIRTLTALRDALLPKLMSGEVRVVS